MVREFVVQPIGVIRSPLKDPADAPKQGALTDQEAEVVVDPVYLSALDGLAGRVAPEGEAVSGVSVHRKSGKIIVIPERAPG